MPRFSGRRKIPYRPDLRGMPMYLQIVVSINGNELHSYSFAESEILIGRSAECDVLLDNLGVSRTHAKILRQGNSLQIVDLNSGNGTFLNGKWVNEATVSAGDTVGIGKFSLTMKLSNERLPEAEVQSTAEADTVISSTVFLRPEETRKILQQSQGAKPAPVMAPSRPSKSEPAVAQPIGWIFAAGALLGLFCGWLFWG